MAEQEKPSDLAEEVVARLSELLGFERWAHELEELVTEWLSTVGTYYEQKIPWDAVDELWRRTNEVLSMETASRHGIEIPGLDQE